MKNKNIEPKTKDKAAKQPRSFKVGVFDVAIILIVILSVVGIYFRFNLIESITQSSTTKDVVISYRISNIRHTTPNYISVGDKVYISSSGELLGTIINASEEMSNALNVTPSSEEFLVDGDYVEVFYPNSESRVDAHGRLTCTGAYTEDRGLLINSSTHITAGQSFEVRTELATFVITITSIDLSE